jgi:hypothetical protein
MDLNRVWSELKSLTDYDTDLFVQSPVELSIHSMEW